MKKEMNNGKGKVALVTGANGFIGSHLVESLIKNNWTVHGTSRHPQDTPFLDERGVKKKIILHVLDVRDEKATQTLIRENAFDAIFHLASQSDTWKSTKQPHETFDVNVRGTLNLLEAIRRHNNRATVMLAGSVRVFNSKSAQTHLGTFHPYDASKLEAELLGKSYFHTYGLNGAVAQNTNAYGGNDRNFSRLIPRIMDGIFTSQKVTIFGDGKVKRDFIFVEDLVQGLISLHNALLEKPHIRGKSFVFATGKQHSIQQVLSIIQKYSPKTFEVVFDQSRSLVERDQEPLQVENTLKGIGWKAQTSIEKGLGATYEWYQDFFNAKKELRE